MVYSQDEGPNFQPASFQSSTWLRASQAVPPSPQAASLGRFGNVSVNYYSGSPGIEVPVYSLSGKYVQMPVALSYDANVVQVAKLPSWTGTGWTLQAGGVITKNVLGNPDIASNYFHWNLPPSPAAGFDPSLLNGPLSDLIREYEFMEQVLAGNIETQPDVYYFNVPGYSGSFVIDRNGQVIFRDYTDWSITVHWNNVPFPADPAAGWAAENLYDITGFTLTDPSGNVYEFGQSAGEDQSLHAHREYTAFYTEIITPSPPTPNQTQFRYNSSWYLRRIISAGGAEIIELENALIHQVPGVPANVNPFSNPFNASSDDSVVFPSQTVQDPCCPALYSGSAGSGLGAGGNQRIYNRRYLKSATLSIGGEPAERLFFHAGPVPTPPDIYQYGPRSSDIRLDSVTVQRRWKGSWENALSFQFGYDLSTGRLTLKSMRESSPDGAVQKPAWQFEYNPGELPSTNSEAMDYWGYYNGQHSNSTLVPRITVDGNNFNPGGANRKAYFQSTGILKSIQYPTGGRTELEYEGHTIPEEDPDLGTHIGGYRIRSIADFAENGAPGQRRTFQYTMPDGASSGLLLQQMKPYEHTYHTNHENPDIGCMNSPTLGNADPCVCRQYSCASITIFASGVGPYSFVQGNHIGYSRVEEIIGEPQQASNIGQNVYWFENSPVGNELWDVSNGKLKTMEIWDASNRKIKETAYAHTFTPVGCPGAGCPEMIGFKVITPPVQDNKIRLCKRADNGYYEWTVLSGTTSSFPACSEVKVFRSKLERLSYLARTFWYRLDAVTTTDYFYTPGSPGTVQKTVNYTYGNNSLAMPTAIAFNNSDGNEFRTEVEYYTSGAIKAIPKKVKKLVGGIVAAGTNQTFDGAGRPMTISEILRDNSELLRVSVSGYNAAGRPNGVSFMGELPETFIWENGLLVKRIKGGWDWRYDYNNLRLPISFTDIDGQAVHYEYDGLLRLKRSRARNNNIITDLAYNYGSPNSIVSTTTYSDAPTQTLSEEFDGLGRPIRSIHNGVVKKEQFYDAYGRMWKETYLPGNFVTYDFDNSPLNRMVKQTFPDGHFARTLYGADGNYYKTTAIDEKGNESSVLTEIVERTFRTIDALGGVTTFTYAPHGAPQQVQPPSGAPYLYDYDNRRRLTYKKVPGARAQIFRYHDENNLLKYSIDGKGNRIDHYYDSYLREVRATLAQVSNWDPEAPNAPHGAPGSDILITRYGEEFADLPPVYKGRVRETAAKLFGSGALTVSGFAETKFSYDNFGRPTGRVETYPFLPGNTSGADTWTFQFNHADWLTFEQRSATGVNTAQSHTYDNFGREIYYAFGAGAPEAAAVAMTWNDRDQMSSKKLGYAGGRQLDLINYRYNERGWLTHINDVLRERWDTPYEICQGPSPGEGHTFVQMEEQTNLQGLLELLCNEENVVVRGTDPCEQGDCFDELADYQVSLQSGLKKEKQVTDLSIHNLYRIAAQVVPLPQMPYRWTSDSGAATLLSRDDSQALASDLRTWMDANQYRYDSVTVRPKVIPGKEGNLELSIRVYGTNLPLDFLVFSFDNATPYSRASFRKTNTRLAPCAVKPLPERETQLQGLAQNPAQLNYPTALYKILVAGSATPLWRFEAELGGLNPNHRRDVRIPVMNADERFSVRMTNGATAVWTLAQLLNERQQNGLSGVTAIERIIEKTTTNPCTLPPLECSAVQQDKQTQSLAEIQNAMCNMNPAQLSFPLTLYYVRLCDGSTTYILGQTLLQNLQGPYQVLGQMQVTGLDQLFNVAITRRRPLFAMQFAYEPNGNIGEMKWKVTAHDVKYYLNDYDPLNRLLGSSYGVEREVQSGTALPFVERIGTQEYDEFGISYDPIGNIEKLSRRGLIPSGNCFDPGLIDDLTYHYGAEGRLSGVTDAAPEPFRPHGFKPGAGGNTHYQYDHNGNLTNDAHKGMQFSYNFLNLPLSISTPQGTLHFLYDATGRKWAKLGPDGTRFYAGNIEYLDDKIQHIAFADGRLVAEYNENGIFPNKYRAEYFRTDHLGNTRLTFSDFNHDGVISPRITSGTPTPYETEITSENHYYPFGLGQTGPWYASVAPENKYRYNGKEWNEAWGLNMYDYGARWYMPDLGRWGGVDPMAERYNDISPYCYVGNLPLVAVDPDGMRIAVVGSKDFQNDVLATLLTLAWLSETGEKLVNMVLASARTFVIFDPSIMKDKISEFEVNSIPTYHEFESNPKYETLPFDISEAKKPLGKLDGNIPNSPEVTLGHEMYHFLSRGISGFVSDGKRSILADEVGAVEVENMVRKDLGLPLRTHYAGIRVFGKGIRKDQHGQYHLIDKSGYATKLPFKTLSRNSDVSERLGRRNEKPSYMFYRVPMPINSSQLLLYEKVK